MGKFPLGPRFSSPRSNPTTAAAGGTCGSSCCGARGGFLLMGGRCIRFFLGVCNIYVIYIPLEYIIIETPYPFPHAYTLVCVSFLPFVLHCFCRGWKETDLRFHGLQVHTLPPMPWVHQRAWKSGAWTLSFVFSRIRMLKEHCKFARSKVMMGDDHTVPWRGTRNMSMLSTAYRLLFPGATSQQLWLLEKKAGRVATTWHENRCKCKMAILAKKQPSECSSLAAEGSTQLSALEPPEACVQCHPLLLRKNWGSIESPITNKNTNMGPDVAEDSFSF